jgi:hypothetical protein
MNTTHLKVEFMFGVERDRDGLYIGHDERQSAIRAIRNEAISLFDGYTLTPSCGGWRSPSGKIVTEDGYIMTIIMPVFNPAHEDQWNGDIENLRESIKKMLHQESVVVVKTLVEVV